MEIHLNALIRFGARLACVALAATISTGFAFAASLGFSPVGLFIGASEKTGAITLINKNASSPLRVQVRVQRWRQVNGTEQLEPTRDVIASPPTTVIPAGQKYTLRIARVSAAPVSAEEGYRLIINELPSPIDPGHEQHGVNILISASLPVFFSPKNATPKMQWKVWNQGGQMHVRATNSGTRHIQLSGLSVQGPKGPTAIQANGSNAYVLPGSTLDYASAPGAQAYPAGTSVTITAAKGTPFEVHDQVTVSEP